MTQIKVQIKGMKELQEKLGRFGDKTYLKDLKRGMVISTGLVKNTARTIVPVDTGALRRSIKDNVKYSLRGIEGIIEPMEKYGAAVEFGRKPGAFPPIGALDRWARKRGLNPFLVARAIARKGTKAQPFMKPAFEMTKAKITSIFNSIIKRLLQR